MTDISTTEQWAAVEGLVPSIGEVTLRELFDADPERGRRMSVTAGDLHVDLSKHLVTDEILHALTELAHAARLPAQRAAMFRGDRINTTEDRSVLHTALRLPADAELVVDGSDVVADVHAVLARMTDLADRVRSGEWTGYTGERIDTVVNIGIGGSDLGPVMVDAALRDLQTAGIRARYVSNVDPADLTATLAEINPATTLVVVASKTFTTQETMANAHAARRHFIEALRSEDAIASHFVAVSTAADKVADFGIAPDNMFGFWDWVGGRYSVSSAIGLSVMITAGPAAFVEMLEGFHTMDLHFATEAPEHNAPVLMALLGIWYTCFLGAQSKAVIPYSQDLHRFPAYLQQLTMESLGKSVRLDGSDVTYPTGEVYWGEPGTNGQHAFFQLLHQGTQLVPVDFIGVARPAADLAADVPGSAEPVSMHDMLMANLFAQSRVLAFGKTEEEVLADGVDPALAPHKVMPGNRPSTTILAPSLSPSVVGQLIALYEHIVFTQAAILGINAFDQWGVELGKAQAGELLSALTAETHPEPGFDSSTDSLVEIYREARGRR
ncbi:MULTISPECIES: glucose-6-phosphate isomerase [Dietzia]|uniref:Glucose-6-phosphate isomerase n=1 Tax=Dietzia cinnamea TaxID=321318 RepID=A0AAW5QBB2_9ACTN|nr:MULTISPECIES: glucose-6-phosphate isomerase [Dietzia]KZO60076.1 glucose-6-phosphate isomerase [Dietzia maris]AVM63241.1 glucose-6-phosphate isomerase [Dietzia sp. oral taxon 368]MBM7229709.1 glucose-6-phosphate isomerase [Dietzia cinnamea]MCT1640213.1 glucose-6-phosphate isomerase [Dietzia cinnamea]MCT1713277.1 glucose-6-phosphate isomerase [Dietzia cinnamea]